jgi:hypothetical protein
MVIGAHNHARLIAAAAGAIHESGRSIERAGAVIEAMKVLVGDGYHKIGQAQESLRLLDAALARQFVRPR